MTLEIGAIAPDFTLKTKTADGLKDVTLSEHKGESNVVLLFFLLHLPVYAWQKPVRLGTTWKLTKN